MLARLFLSLWNIHRSTTALRCCNESHCKVENEKKMKMCEF